jgi:P-type Cu2+ transporter
MQSKTDQTFLRSEDNRSTDPCDHCGLPAPVRKGDELTFCCSGCLGAYQLIHHWGLEDYYALRERLLDGDGTPVNAKPISSAQWDELAKANLLGASAPKKLGDGLVCSRMAIEGVHCGACVWLIEKMATIAPGWQSARVGMHDHSIEVTYDPAVTGLSRIADDLSGLGYRVLPWVEGAGAERYRSESRQRLVQIAIAGFCAMNAMWIAVAIYAGEYSGIAASQFALLRVVGVLLGVVAAFGPGRTFFRGAFAAIKTRTPHMDLPIALGVGVGAVAGIISLIVGHADIYFDSVAVLVFLLLVGRWIQFRQQHRAADAVSLLMRMTPSLAVCVAEDGSHSTVPADSLRPGDRFYVIAGETVPVDGQLIQGATSIDRSLMTGESMPLSIRSGDTVEAGSLNLQSPITVRATASREDSRITKLMRLVEEASLKRTPIVQLADSIASRFVIVVLCLAALTIAIWWRVDPMQAASHAVALLIVACPCALALATPLAIAVTLGRAAKRKLLIRSGETLERLATPGKIWFDKTGTLTKGRPQLVVDNLDDHTLALCASLEVQSTHPLAMAIVEAAKQRQIELHPVERLVDVQQTSGAGIRGIVDGYHVSFGTLDFIRRSVLELDDETLASVAAFAKEGVTPVAVAVDGEIISVLGIGDALRPEAIQTIRMLRERGWEVGILSGDHPAAVNAVAKKLGIVGDVRGGLSPEQKLATIDKSRYPGTTLVMVGDGVNDAAALAAADVGIAIRGGAEASLQAAPVYLADGKLSGVIGLVDASAATVRVIRRNFCISLFYNSFAVGLSVCGLINPLLAAILMPISSLTILSLTLGSRTFAVDDVKGGTEA